MIDIQAPTRLVISTLTLLACVATSSCGGGGGDPVVSSPSLVTTASAITVPPETPASSLPLAQAATSTSAATPTATSLSGKLVVGYQGWFGCPGDDGDNSDWQHWFVNAVSATTLTFDALPSVRGLDPADLCETGIARSSGGTVQLFSAQRQGVVSTHFQWMKEHGIDGAAVQRFVVELSDAARQRRTEKVLANARVAAEANDRVFYLTYDVSGADAARVVAAIRQDWQRVTATLKITDSPAYLHDGGKPVLQLWGFGFIDHPGEPAEVAALIADLKSGSGGLAAATVVGGVPSQWRTLTGDSKTAAAWAAVYRSFEVISPWSVGRFGDEASADAFIKNVVEPDLVETRRLGLRYLPVIFPGFSWRNLMINRGQAEQGALNVIPRRCGNFMWRQVWNLLNTRTDMMYAAMFDEVDEATALFRVEPEPANLPLGATMLSLNQDGCSLPDDWYLRVTGQAASFLHSARLPPESLAALIQP
jgi:hypothetical protein